MDWLPAATHVLGPAALSWAVTSHPKGLLHTTEGGGWTSYNGWTEAPHATVMPLPCVGVEVRQHIPFSQAAMGLVHSGGVETNRAYVFQFELVGTCAGTAGLYDWTHADDAVLADLYRKVIEPLSTAFGIPIRALPFQAYPDSYGPRGVTNTVRLSGAEWLAYSGWMGHQHAVESLHGDPGAFPWDRMIANAGGDMPLTDAEWKRLSDLMDSKAATYADAVENRYAVKLTDGSIVNRDVELGSLDALIHQVLAKVSTGGGGGAVDPAALAAALAPALAPAIAAEFAKRLARN